VSTLIAIIIKSAWLPFFWLYLTWLNLMIILLDGWESCPVLSSICFVVVWFRVKWIPFLFAQKRKGCMSVKEYKIRYKAWGIKGVVRADCKRRNDEAWHDMTWHDVTWHAAGRPVWPQTYFLLSGCTPSSPGLRFLSSFVIMSVCSYVSLLFFLSLYVSVSISLSVLLSFLVNWRSLLTQKMHSVDLTWRDLTRLNISLWATKRLSWRKSLDK
jgi:hypothetical protein